tara:strand:- start:300 stop:533 length:234 start_codon:yes stop_codon:yes gene_type:complete
VAKADDDVVVDDDEVVVDKDDLKDESIVSFLLLQPCPISLEFLLECKRCDCNAGVETTSSARFETEKPTAGRAVPLW